MQFHVIALLAGVQAQLHATKKQGNIAAFQECIHGSCHSAFTPQLEFQKFADVGLRPQLKFF